MGGHQSFYYCSGNWFCNSFISLPNLCLLTKNKAVTAIKRISVGMSHQQNPNVAYSKNPIVTFYLSSSSSFFLISAISFFCFLVLPTYAPPKMAARINSMK